MQHEWKGLQDEGPSYLGVRPVYVCMHCHTEAVRVGKSMRGRKTGTILTNKDCARRSSSTTPKQRRTYAPIAAGALDTSAAEEADLRQAAQAEQIAVALVRDAAERVLRNTDIDNQTELLRLAQVLAAYSKGVLDARHPE